MKEWWDSVNLRPILEQLLSSEEDADRWQDEATVSLADNFDLQGEPYAPEVRPEEDTPAQCWGLKANINRRNVSWEKLSGQLA